MSDVDGVGDVFAASDEMILAETIVVDPILGMKIGEPDPQPMLNVTVEGRLNGSEERRTLLFAVPFSGVEPLLELIINGARALATYERTKADPDV